MVGGETLIPLHAPATATMNLNDYLAAKYSMDTVENLLAQLHSSPLARFPQPQPVNPTNAHTLQRLVTADALDDAGRGGEAQLLRDPNQHVVVHEGRVRAGRFTPSHLIGAYSNALSHLQDWSHSAGGHNATFLPSIPTYIPTVRGGPLGTTHLPTNMRSGLTRLPNGVRQEMTTFALTGQDQPEGTFRIDHHNDLDYDPFLPSHETHAPTFVHASGVGNYLADRLQEHMGYHEDVTNPSFTNNSPDLNDRLQTHARLMQELRNAPYDEVDPRHDSERPVE